MMRSAVPALVLACALVACSATEPVVPEPSASSSAPTTGAPTATQLSFGAAESVTWEPAAEVSAELLLRIDKVRAGDFADFEGLAGSGITEDNLPFYVDAVIANEGDADLGGLDVPLYLQDSHETLSPPWGFATPFRACDSGPLPEPFGAGEEVAMCLVFFASPGASFESITFRPTPDAAAVSWTGDVAVRAGKRR